MIDAGETALPQFFWGSVSLFWFAPEAVVKVFLAMAAAFDR
jgi:hypothetical protein